MKISINDVLLQKLAKIEADHGQLQERRREVFALPANDPSALIFATTQLEYFLSDHFRDEEFLLEEIEARGYERHVSLHCDLQTRLRAIRWSYVEARTQGAPQNPQHLLDFLNDYLADHCDVVDAAAFRDLEKRIAAPPSGLSADQSQDSKFDNFDALCQAAISRRVRRVLSFCQQNRSEAAALLPPLFFAAPAFADAFDTALYRVIYPLMRGYGSLRRLSAGVALAGLDEENFWEAIPETLSKSIAAAWSQAWDHLRLIEGRNDRGVSVMRVRKELKELRECLGFRVARDYDLPACGNRELDLLKSLFDARSDWTAQLKECWAVLRALYDQEMIQREAREGVLRDELLTTLNKFPPEWGDLILFTCYRVFPRITTGYLANFTTNLGRSAEQREEWLPYIMHYLRKARASADLRDQEILEERKVREQPFELRLSAARNG
jgi:hemerythrin